MKKTIRNNKVKILILLSAVIICVILSVVYIKNNKVEKYMAKEEKIVTENKNKKNETESISNSDVDYDKTNMQTDNSNSDEKNNMQSQYSEEFMNDYFKEVEKLQENNTQENILILTSNEKPENTYGASNIIEAPNNQYIFEYDSENAKEEAFAKLKEDNSIKNVEENITYEALGTSFNSWGIEKTGLNKAITVANVRDLEEVDVAIIDTGCNTTLFNQNFDNSKIKEAYNVLSSSVEEDMTDEVGHGTHIAGTIAEGTPDNVRLIPVKVSTSRDMSLLNVLAGINYVVYYQKADVINLSIGAAGTSEIMYQTIENAYSNNIICVAAAGNDGSDEIFSPAAYDNTISISACDSSLNIADFSNYGSTIDFTAPGQYIKSINGTMSGTSMACPHAVCAVAILKSYDKDINFEETKEILKKYAIDLGDSGWDKYYGYGLINLSNVKYCSCGCINCTSINCDGCGCANCIYDDEQDIKDGIYEISVFNSKYSNLCLEVANGSSQNCANIQLGTWINKYYDKDKFEVTYNKKTGYYTIKSVASGKVLDIQWGAKELRTNVWQYEANGSKAQQWKIEQNSDGSYKIISALTGFALDICDGTMKSGQNVQVYTSKGNDAQKFKFIKQDETIPEKVLEDGTYEISMSNSKYSKLCLEVANGSSKSGENIQLGTWINKYYDKDKFELKYNSETGYYTIKSIVSGKVLDVQGGLTSVGTNVWQYDSNGTKAQQWEIEKRSDGSYKIISVLSGLVLDISSGTMKNGQNVQVYTSNDTNAQKFNFIKQDETIPKKVLENGIYEISMFNSKYSKLCLEVEKGSSKSGANVQLGTWINKYYDKDKFELKYNSETGYYTIKSVVSGKVLDVQGGSTSVGSNVWQYDSNGTKAQQWEIEKRSDGSYKIISVLSGLVLDISSGTMKNGQNVQVYTSNDTNAQKFNFIKQDEEVEEQALEDGTYKIESASNQNLAIDVKDDSRANGGNILLGPTSDSMSNEFNLRYNEKTGYYTILSVNSGKVLDVQNGSTELRTNIWQYDYNGTKAQQWKIEKNSDGSYTIISALTGFALDIQDANLINGQNIQVYTQNKTNAQKFLFVKQEYKTEKYIEDDIYKILTKQDTSKGFDIEDSGTSNGTNLQIWSYVAEQQQQFNISYKNGYYYIINYNSGKAMQAVDSKVKQYTLDNNNENQKWMLKKNGSSYSFVSKSTGLAMTASSLSNGTHLTLSTYTSNDSQCFIISNVIPIEQGTFGQSGLSVKGDSRGSLLKYYKIGKGNNVFFATFAVHGWEDLYDYDGQALTNIANDFSNYLKQMTDLSLLKKWTIYIFPSVNPDGEYYGYTNNGPGRTSLYSAAPSNKGIDINRCWSTGFTSYTSDRNYNGTEAFQSYEARCLRDFLLNKRATNGQTVLVDLHGWLNETIGDNGIGSFYRSQYGMSKHISTYGKGYLVNWAINNLGYNGKAARASLVELPDCGSSSSQYINATINMLNSVSISEIKESKKVEVTDESKLNVALSGVLKKDKPEYSELDSYVETFNNKTGIYVEESSQEQFLNIVNKIAKSRYSINEDGFLKIERSDESNKYDEKLKKIINSNQLYVFEINSITYTVNDFSGEIEEYPFEEMDPELEYDYVENGDSHVYAISENKSGKINQENALIDILNK